MRPRFNLDSYSEALLVALYESAVSGQDEYIIREHVKNYLPSKNENLARLTISTLLDKEDIEIESRQIVVPSDDGWDEKTIRAECVFLTAGGFNRVANWDDEKYTQVRWLFGAAGAAPLERESVPASDRTVTLNHNQSDYRESVAALDGVIEEFRKDQCLDNELGHEKGALLLALEGGRKLLNDTEVNVRIGVALILEPLKRLVEKYEQALVGALASAAISLFLKLFEIG
jgi:hypothetical protein